MGQRHKETFHERSYVEAEHTEGAQHHEPRQKRRRASAEEPQWAAAT